ncbi:hypothetical protein F5I97DRAFT_1662082 [Phlebopus sp. FC_14]|nr:hypothetical protein F5I97DRAFT_1662082 [Phlebopus sp. FC_14]
MQRSVASTAPWLALKSTYGLPIHMLDDNLITIRLQWRTPWNECNPLGVCWAHLEELFDDSWPQWGVVTDLDFAELNVHGDDIICILSRALSGRYVWP